MLWKLLYKKLLDTMRNKEKSDFSMNVFKVFLYEFCFIVLYAPATQNIC